MIYKAVRGLFWQTELFRVETECTLELRRYCRERIGLRRSARMRYKQVGTNSFVVETAWGRPVMEVYKVESWA